jgi:hypothetical protein
MTTSARIKTALCDILDERAEEIQALRSVRVIAIVLTLDAAGCVEYEQVRYESSKEKRRTKRDTTRNPC